jgi:hypothetical protein
MTGSMTGAANVCVVQKQQVEEQVWLENPKVLIRQYH